jgi:hypothetical protein
LCFLSSPFSFLFFLFSFLFRAVSEAGGVHEQVVRTVSMQYESEMERLHIVCSGYAKAEKLLALVAMQRRLLQSKEQIHLSYVKVFPVFLHLADVWQMFSFFSP